MEIVYVYQKKRKEFGRQPLFRDRPAELTTNILPDPSYMNNYIIKTPRNSLVSSIPDMSEHDVNTESHVVASKGVLHREGGWPKDVDSTDVEHKLRFRKKVEKDEEYLRVIKTLSESVEHCIKQNNTVNIYEECFVEKSENISTVSSPSSRTLNVFRDPNSVKRSVSFVSWHPDAGRKIAVAYSNLQFQYSSSDSSNDSFIWDLENPNVFDQKLTPPSPLVCLKYNPKDQNVLIGGMYNGLVGVWDVRKGPNPYDCSAIEKSHKDAVFSVAWINSKTGNNDQMANVKFKGSEFFSTSTDGQVLWWDTRKLSEPTEVILLDPDKNGILVGGVSLDFESTMPTKFMVGSENGSAFLCNKKSKTPAERITHIFPGHHGPITSIQRNPFYPRNFLTVGDWSAKVWVDDIKTPLISSKYHQTYLTDGCWSPARPAVFCTSKNDGSVDFWDYIFKQNDPILSLQVSQSPINCVKIQDQGKLVVAGASDGTVTLLELSDSLSKIQPNEKATFSQMLEREAKREKLLESAAKEKRLKAQQMQKKQGGSNKELAGPSIDDILKRAEEEFTKALSEKDETGTKMRK